MIRVTFDPKKLEGDQAKDWTVWSTRAKAATDAVIAEWEEKLAEWLELPENTRPRFKFQANFKDKVWGDLKRFLHEHVFNKKCAYCERRISGFYPDAEHFRPKGSVKIPVNGTRVQPEIELELEPKGRTVKVPHPGYFWLAYEWRNLVPSCKFCNSPPGKGDQWPTASGHALLARLSATEVKAAKAAFAAGTGAELHESKRWPGLYYLTPVDLDRLESPLLINPMNVSDAFDPSLHVKFGVRGIVAARNGSAFGEACIAVYNLEDEDVRIDRQTAQEQIHHRYFTKVAANPVDSESNDGADDGLQGYRNGKEPFSAAALAHLQRAVAKIVQQVGKPSS